MKNNAKLLVNVSDVAKRLGITFSALQKEFAECDITINEGDMVEMETVRYVVSGMYAHEYSWGEELHIENGNVGSHIHWTQMRDTDGTEATVQGEMKVRSIAKKLGMDTQMFVQELDKYGYAYGADDMISMGVVSKMIDDLELHDSWVDMVADMDADTVTHSTDKIHCAHSCDMDRKASTCGTGACSKDTTKISTTTSVQDQKTVYDIAMAWGLPATALTAWMGANGFSGTRFTDSEVDKMRCSMQDDVSYRENYNYKHPEAVEPVTTTGSRAADTDTSEDAIAGVYSHSKNVDEVAAHATSGWMKGAAWGLLGLLGLSSLFLFGSRDTEQQVVEAPAPEIHSVALDEEIAPVGQEEVDYEAEIFATQSAILEEEAENNFNPLEEVKIFVNELVGGYPDTPEYQKKLIEPTHNAPDELPRTGTN